MSGSSPKKPTPVLTTPTSRSQQARSFLTSDAEEKQAEVTTAKPKASAANDRKQKAAARFMADHGITDASTLDFTRINCDIPKSLHKWLNVYARSSDDYLGLFYAY